jgi:hypothetical protein
MTVGCIKRVMQIGAMFFIVDYSTAFTKVESVIVMASPTSTPSPTFGLSLLKNRHLTSQVRAPIDTCSYGISQLFFTDIVPLRTLHYVRVLRGELRLSRYWQTTKSGLSSFQIASLANSSISTTRRLRRRSQTPLSAVLTIYA